MLAGTKQGPTIVKSLTHRRCTSISPVFTKSVVVAAAKERRGKTAAGPLQQQEQQQHELVVGIDLGTTNSVIAHIVDGKPVSIPNEQGDTLTPSVVSFLADGSTVVGRAAKKQNPSTTYYSVKRLIGRVYADPAVQEERSRLAYKVTTS